MLKRVSSAMVLLIIGFPAIALGGIPYFLLITFFLGMAAWEYANFFEKQGANSARWWLVIGIILISGTQFFWPSYTNALFTLMVFVLTTVHLAEYEYGAAHTAMSFAMSLSGLVYIGWVGSYLFSLRALEHGAWWVMFILPCVWLVDIGAFMIGAAYGKHSMAPRLSPKKSWEGFFAGAFTGMLAGGFLAYVYSTWGPLHIQIGYGALFGLLAGFFSPLGDLGESMLKREAGIKDSGNLIPGHGGAFDRIDSWLWVGVLGYYYIIWFIR